jgi:SAM-dependent methyltransferase
VSEDRRVAARALAHDAISTGEPLRWFEDLYRAAETDGVTVPWADLTVNPHLASWTRLADLPSGRALVVGCGYGDDAEWLSGQGWDVVAFDIAETAVERARERFPGSPVGYVAADLLQVPVEWTAHRFDLVVEAYTIQVLPPGSAERAAAIHALADMTGQTLLVIARGRDPGDDSGSMPWPVTKSELDALSDAGLDEIEFEDFTDDEVPPTRRFRVTYRRCGTSDHKM